MRQRIKSPKVLPVLVFGMVIAVLLAADLLGGTKEFSPNENRCLAAMPKISGQEALEGDFQKQYENYLSDQFCFRDSWITARTGILKTCGVKDIGDTYIGSDGYYFEKITPGSVDDRLFERNLRGVRKLFDYEREQGFSPKQLQILVLPTAAGVLTEKLPQNAPLFDQASCFDRIRSQLSEYTVIDGQGALQAAHKEDPKAQLYYRTDHHWTGDGVLAAYRQWLSDTGRPALEADSYHKRTVTTDFRGSLYSRVLDDSAAHDNIWVYEKKGPENACRVTIGGQSKEQEASDRAVKRTKDGSKAGDEPRLNGLYDESKLEEKDKYAYFFGGNYGQVEIDTQKPGKDRLLVIKDSFANSFVPMLTEHYSRICMLDLRYYKGSVREYVREKGITEILVLYNISNFVSDRDIFLMGMDR